MNLVEIKDVSVSYREDIALKNISLIIKKQTFLSVIGPNGAGKTTLLTVINGLGKIISGSVKVFGRDLNKRNINHIRKEIGYVPQNLNIDSKSPISVREVVSIGRFGKIGLLHCLNDEDKKIITSAMNMVGIGAMAERPIGHLSAGEQQKVAIARALAQQPKIMLLDEPTSNLDPKSQIDIIKLIDRIYREQRITIVFVTHILSHISTACAEAVLIKKGRIIWTGEIKKLFQEDLLSSLYDCPIEITDKGDRIVAGPKW